MVGDKTCSGIVQGWERLVWMEGTIMASDDEAGAQSENIKSLAG